VLDSALESRARQGVNQFVIVPLFFGPSGALTGDVPACVARVRAKFPAIEVRLARCLVDVKDEADDRMAAMLEDQVRARISSAGPRPAVILVDHGSPERAVTLVRDHLAARLASRLGDLVTGVRAASMQRRPGAEFDFNEPSLARALNESNPGATPVVVAMQFLLPGRHAGPDGDIARICEAACRRNPGLSVEMTDLVGSHPKLIEVLADRARSVLHFF